MDKFALTVENLTKIYSDSKNKKVNKALNNLNFKEVSCWTCHRGNKIPERSPFKMS